MAKSFFFSFITLWKKLVTLIAVTIIYAIGIGLGSFLYRLGKHKETNPGWHAIASSNNLEDMF